MLFTHTTQDAVPHIWRHGRPPLATQGVQARYTLACTNIFCLFCQCKYRERVTQHPPPSVGTLASGTGAWAGRWSTQWRRDLEPPLGTTVGPQRPPVRILCLRGESDNIQATWLTCLRCVATLAQDSLSKVCSNNQPVAPLQTAGWSC